MSYIAEELERQIDQAQTNAKQVADKTGISPSQIYKWINGEQTSITPEQLSSLAKALSKDPFEHASLIRAHLLDECFGPGKELIRIEIAHPSELKDRPRFRSKREQALAFLTELSIKSKSASDLLIQLARSHGAKI